MCIMPTVEMEGSTNNYNSSDIFYEVIKDIANILNDQTRYIKTIGLGSGSTIALFVKELGNFVDMNKFEFVTTSMQIRIQAERFNTKFTDEKKIPEIDIVLDGADQIDSDFNMVKGGGGALFREKIVMYCSKKKIILAVSEKFVDEFDFPLPVEVHPFARFSVLEKLKKYGKPKLRTDYKDFPFITENGNIIYDISEYNDIGKKNACTVEMEIKNIPGVIEVGLFPKLSDIIFYKIDKKNGSFKKIEG